MDYVNTTNANRAQAILFTDGYTVFITFSDGAQAGIDTFTDDSAQEVSSHLEKTSEFTEASRVPGESRNAGEGSRTVGDNLKPELLLLAKLES